MAALGFAAAKCERKYASLKMSPAVAAAAICTLTKFSKAGNFLSQNVSRWAITKLTAHVYHGKQICVTRVDEKRTRGRT